MKKLAACAIDTGARGIKVYQTNSHMLAERALLSAYPVVAQLVGADSFADLARALWHAQPPVQGDVGRWGDGLGAFIRTSAQLQDEPYLGDVAELEWAMHCSARAADARADVGTLALLTQHDPAELGVRLAPGCVVLRSAWPVVSIILAHTQGQPTLEETGEQLRAHVAQDALVWRAGLKVLVREAHEGEYTLLTALLAGQSLAAALNAAVLLDFAAWLPEAVQSGLLLGVHQI